MWNDAHDLQGIELKLEKSFRNLTQKRKAVFFNSGAAAFYFLLKALQGSSDKKEVIIPAYTAGSLVVAIRQAGLVPVLCDISLDTFNMDFKKVHSLINERTLAVVGIHMFGLFSCGIEEYKKYLPGIFLIEDCAQSFGTSFAQKPVGSFGDASFFSFNRGKNLTVYNGGCLLLDDKKLSAAIIKDYQAIDEVGFIPGFQAFLKLLALSIVVKPGIYGLSRGLLERFRDNVPPEKIEVAKLSTYQLAALYRFMNESSAAVKNRIDNGLFLLNHLAAVPGIRLPLIYPQSSICFNRFPVIFDDIKKIKLVQEALDMNGIEASRMYYKPLHKMFDLGYKSGDFSNAEYFAEHVLTLPVHPLMSDKDIARLIKVIKGCL
jgi:dTDP-4-amino-4,6-dideoxygalactose transaminase